MSILATHDDADGFRILAEGSAPVVAYVPSRREIKLAVAEGGRELLLYLDADKTPALINALMAEVHKHKLATRRRQAPKPLLRRQANHPRPISVAR